MKTSKKRFNKIGILGGTFDPPHTGHLEISKFAIKKLNLSELIWAVTKKNPLKKKPFFKLKKRIFLSKKITKNIHKINVKSFDKFTKSSKTIKLIKYVKKKNHYSIIYFIMGSDNLINFHKWDNYKKLLKLTNLVVFSRKGYDTKAKKSVIMKHLKQKNIKFVNNLKINIS